MSLFDGAQPLPVAVSEGKAFHRGDVVILRCLRPLNEQTLARLCELVRPLSDRTGIEFVFIDDTLEVVEPKP